MGIGSFFTALNRKKIVAEGTQATQLARVLSTIDLTALGVGSTLGVGVYVLAGTVAKQSAGPAVVLSFLIAALASVFAGLCYAEFGARVPKAGSAYVYSYVCVGEFVAFVIGWNLILEYVIGAASVSRGLSTYIDSLTDNAMQNAFRKAMPIDVEFLSQYPDFFAFFATMAFAVALAFGVKESSNVNNVFTVINVGVVLFVIIAGSFKANPDNWNIPKDQVPSDAGEGGFFPFGISGVIKGAATCFYGFVGFDCIATTGEEAKNPQKSIPLAIIISLAIIFLAYFGVSSVLTLMWPYYLQDPDAPLPYVFLKVGWPVAKWIVSIGAIFGLFASLIGALFPLPRVIYAMSSDGLIFRFLSKVHPRFQTPIIGTLLGGFLTGSMAALFDLDHLVKMMSIGTLMAYSIVAACVMLLRYEEDEDSEMLHDEEPLSMKRLIIQIFNLNCTTHSTRLSSTIVCWEVLVFFFLCIGETAIIVHLADPLSAGNYWAIYGLTAMSTLLVGVVIAIGIQPTSTKHLSFKVPFVPVLPAVSILVNIYLMMMLDDQTWIRFIIWMLIGFLIYFGYGIRKSSQKTNGEVTTRKSLNTTDGESNVAYDSVESG